MDASAVSQILRIVGQVTDPRRHNRLHPLPEMIIMAVMAVLCGADGWEDVGEFVSEREEWLKTFLNIPHGAPCADTFERVFARLDPPQVEDCIHRWLQALNLSSAGKQVAIDGKSLRRSFQQAWDKSGMAHMVSAFATDNRLALAQLATEGKGGEIGAIQSLLEMVDLKGCTVTIDAIGCQKEIAGKIVTGKGNYLLSVKDNQPTLHAKVKALLDEAILEQLAGWEGGSHFQQTNGGHGRIETRDIWYTTEVASLGELLEQWPGLKAIVAVQRKRQVVGKEPTTERHYFICSDAKLDAEHAGQMIRGHWAIENSLHYVLDVSFNEDQSRVRKNHGAENLSRLRRLTANLLQLDPKKGSPPKPLTRSWGLQWIAAVRAYADGSEN
jgi:predicted transposase YbfD/YdcC